MAGPHPAAPIVLWDHTQAGIRWRVCLHTEINRGPGVRAVRFVKTGKHGKLLDHIGEWGPHGWGGRLSPKIPKYLQDRIAAELRRRILPGDLPAAGGGGSGSRRGSCGGASEALSCGRMSFQAFLAWDLVEACLPDPYRHQAAPSR
jgi:hypothetical protein